MLGRESELRWLERDLQLQPAVALLGPRQAGKTTLARAFAAGRPSVYLDLENPSDRAALEVPRTYLERQRGKLVVLDEVQRLPGLFETLRGVIDDRRAAGERHGQFLLLGSASRDLLRQSSESLAGRITYRELTPIRVDEARDLAPEELWLRGGFPESLLAADDASSLRWREAFLLTYLERDLPQLGVRTPAETLRRLWTMLAHQQGGELNASRLAAAMGLSGKTVSHHIDTFVDLFLVRRLAPWHTNVGKRLSKTPKVYVRDSGLTHALLGIASIEGLLSHPVVGMSWESFAIESLIGGGTARPWFYRTSGGAEIDLLIERTNGEVWAFEMKRSDTPSASRGFHSACEDVKAARRIIVYPGARSYVTAHDVEVLSLADAVALLRI